MTGPEQILHHVERIKPLLAGIAPDMQGAILADLTAIWLCGHPPDVRPEMLALQFRMINLLLAANEAIMFGAAGHPSAYAGN